MFGFTVGTACLAQDPQALLDTTVAHTSPGGTPIPASTLSSFRFPTGNQGSQQPFATNPQPSVAVSCESPTVLNISFNTFHTPEGTKDYAIHYTRIGPYPNNVTGK